MSIRQHIIDYRQLKQSGESQGSLQDHLRTYNHGLIFHEMYAFMLLSITNARELSRLLKLPLHVLEKLINNPFYREFTIPKKKGKARQICAPDLTLRKVQRQLNFYLQRYYILIKPQQVYGFVIREDETVPFCNIAANAQCHVNKKHVLNMDLKDFFSSVSGKQVKALFQSEWFDFSEDVATGLALLTTYKGKLPTGSPTSPVLANFVCLNMDAQLQELAAVHGVTYTRYADDVTFSRDEPLPPSFIENVRGVIADNNFEVNEKKVHHKHFYQQQKVTGLVVNEKVNVDRKFIRKVRAIIHDVQLYGMDAAVMNHYHITTPVTVELRAKFISRLEGYLSFIGQVRGKGDWLYLRYKTAFDNFFELSVQNDTDYESN